ncbi:CHASE3 domain-containing protein [Gilvibacter sp.]|uniref:sensor histidine kinase n=1 Tax=Gilvibacter sp. TaxID=2729997 RepID=UPI0025C159CF|nr:CHASE3 domain-containing protein [Gilvibacter sp.]NQX77629.1 CHASE3 domain-containing protein [Gilvibacter sp.]
MSTKLSLQNLSISSQIFLGFLIVVISVILSIYISYNNSKKIIESEGWVIHTQEVLTQLENIEARLLDLETGQRGFLITGKESYLEPFNSSLAIIYNELELLREKTIDNSSQTPRIDSLKLTIDKKIEELKLTIELRRNIGFEAAKEIVDNDSGKLFMDQMRLQIAAIENEELRLLEIRSLKPEITRRETNAILVGLLFFTIIIVITVFTLITRSITKPIQTLQSGADIIGKGNLDYKFGVHSKNEIGELARSFESMLAELNETLASKELLKKEIELRTQTEQSLIESNQRIEEANKELQRFSYITSHDLQEPLNSIISFANLLKEEERNLSELGQKSIHIINESAFRMKDFIISLLEYSRIGRGGTKTEVDIEKLIANLQTDLHDLLEKKQAKIEYTGKPLKIQAYEIDLIKLFQNLVTNGIKYTDEKTKPHIIIAAEELKDSYKFSVSDNGIGIEKEHYDKIFEVFQRLHTRDQYSGTGIGLSNCRKVVEIHGGELWLTSEVGKGSTFYFTIPKDK